MIKTEQYEGRLIWMGCSVATMKACLIGAYGWEALCRQSATPATLIVSGLPYIADSNTHKYGLSPA